ncbi:GNAT family N-acetyltransferase [Rhizobium cremeum]|uniref:GNAT family N-acetyltransferase n=1 Tax=Rhizobium cremeum TaxID=2813827 RepID=UPI000DE3C422
MTAVIPVRAAGIDDLSALLMLYRELHPTEPPLPEALAAATYRQMLAQPGLTTFLALDGETPVATATLVVTPNLTRDAKPYALIENVVSLTSHRGRGFGRAAVCAAIAAAWRAGCYKAMLLTGRSDEAVHRFYRDCGFRQDKTGFQIRRPA